MEILTADHANCDQCNQMAKGVRFRLGSDILAPKSFLCWEHFGLIAKTVTDTIETDRCPKCHRTNCHNWLDRSDKPQGVSCSCVCCKGSESWSGSSSKSTTDTEGKSWSHGETESISISQGHSEGFGKSRSSCG